MATRRTADAAEMRSIILAGSPELSNDESRLAELLDHLGNHAPTVSAAARLLEILKPADLFEALQRKGLEALGDASLLEDVRDELAKLDKRARQLLTFFAAFRAFSPSDLRDEHSPAALVDLVESGWLSRLHTDDGHTVFEVPRWTRHALRTVLDDWEEALTRRAAITAERHVSFLVPNRSLALLSVAYALEDAAAVAADAGAPPEDRLMTAALALRLSMSTEADERAATVRRTLEELLQKATDVDPEIRAEAALDLSYHELVNGRLGHAFQISEAARTDLPDQHPLRLTLEIEGTRFLWLDGKAEKAKSRLEDLTDRIGHREDIPAVSMRLHHLTGVLADRHGDYRLASKSVLKASALAADAGDEEYRWIYEVTYGAYQSSAGRVDIALEVFEREVPRAREVGRPEWLITLITDLAFFQLHAGEADDALASSTEAVELARARRSRYDLATALRTHGNVLFSLGKIAEAHRVMLEAKHLLSARLSEEGRVPRTAVFLATQAMELGREAEAWDWLKEAESDRDLLRMETFMRAMMLARTGQSDSAFEEVETIRDESDWEDSFHLRTMAEGLRGFLLLEMDRIEEARRSMRETMSMFERSETPLTVAFSFAHVVDLLVGGASATEAFARAPRPYRAAPDADLTGCWWPLRWLSHLCSPTEKALWTVDRAGRWFTGPEGERVEVGGRENLQRILGALAQARAADEGGGLDVEQLAEAAWPDEFIEKNARRNRVYVAIRGLRKLGLAEILLKDESGYHFDPSVPVRVL